VFRTARPPSDCEPWFQALRANEVAVNGDSGTAATSGWPAIRPDWEACTAAVRANTAESSRAVQSNRYARRGSVPRCDLPLGLRPIRELGHSRRVAQRQVIDPCSRCSRALLPVRADRLAHIPPPSLCRQSPPPELQPEPLDPRRPLEPAATPLTDLVWRGAGGSGQETAISETHRIHGSPIRKRSLAIGRLDSGRSR
jgi:hypothetical protein